jgi:hypothetical protein
VPYGKGLEAFKQDPSLRKVPHSLRESSHYRFSDKDEALLLCLFSDSFERAGVIPIPVEYRSKKPVKKAVFTSCRFENQTW